MTALDRDSSAKLRAILEFPNSPLRTFLVASVVGTWVPLSRTAGPIRRGERAIATTVSRAERRRVLELCSITDKTWHNAVTGWVERRLAHLCGKGVVAVFVTPLRGALADCPACGASLAASRNQGTDLPGIRDEPSRNQGTRESGIAAASSDDADAAGRYLQGGGEGVQAPTRLDPETSQSILDTRESDPAAPRRKYAFGRELGEEEAS